MLTISPAVLSAKFPEPAAHQEANSNTIGVLFAVVAAIIMAATIAVSRLGVTTSLAPADLLALRFGIGGAIFLPILLRTWSSLPAAARRAVLPLSFSHGWGMVGCSLLGLTLAPASHAGALGPGCVPLFVALIGFMFFRKRVTYRQAAGLAAIVVGAGTLLLNSVSHQTAHAELSGDLLFVLAALLTASYVSFIEHHRIPALAGNALVIVISALVVVPVYLFAFESNIPSASLLDIACQAVFQGVLMSLAYVAMHKAILELDGTRVTMIMSSIPILTLLAGHFVAGDSLPSLEVFSTFAISAGILYGTLQKRPVQTGNRR